MSDTSYVTAGEIDRNVWSEWSIDATRQQITDRMMELTDEVAALRTERDDYRDRLSRVSDADNLWTPCHQCAGEKERAEAEAFEYDLDASSEQEATHE